MHHPDRRARERLASGLKIALTITIYFSICVLIILLIVGAAP